MRIIAIIMANLRLMGIVGKSEFGKNRIMHHEKQRSNFWSKKEIIFGILGIVLTIALGFLADLF